MVGSGCCSNWSSVLAVFQPPSSQSTLSGWVMRSEANLLLSECQLRPHLGSSPARATALFHQSRRSQRSCWRWDLVGAGSTGRCRFRDNAAVPLRGQRSPRPGSASGARTGFLVLATSPNSWRRSKRRAPEAQPETFLHGNLVVDCHDTHRRRGGARFRPERTSGEKQCYLSGRRSLGERKNGHYER